MGIKRAFKLAAARTIVATIVVAYVGLPAWVDIPPCRMDCSDSTPVDTARTVVWFVGLFVAFLLLIFGAILDRD